MSDFQIENGELVEYTGKGGDVVIPDVCGTGINVIATKSAK